jgi:hypothetical protein
MKTSVFVAKDYPRCGNVTGGFIWNDGKGRHRKRLGSCLLSFRGNSKSPDDLFGKDILKSQILLALSPIPAGDSPKLHRNASKIRAFHRSPFLRWSLHFMEDG